MVTQHTPEEKEKYIERVAALAREGDRAGLADEFDRWLSNELCPPTLPGEFIHEYWGMIYFNAAQKGPDHEAGRLLHEVLLEALHQELMRLSLDMDRIDRVVDAMAAVDFEEDLDVSQALNHLDWNAFASRLSRCDDVERLEGVVDMIMNVPIWSLYPMAALMMRRVCELEPDDSEHILHYGLILAMEPRYAEEAIAALHQAANLNPEVPKPWFCLGELYSEVLYDYQKAEACLRKALALDMRDSECWFLLGTIRARHLARYEEAETAFDQACRFERRHPATPLLTRGHLRFWHLHKGREAIEDYKAALEEDSEHPLAHLHLGIAQLAAAEPKAAHLSLERAYTLLEAVCEREDSIEYFFNFVLLALTLDLSVDQDAEIYMEQLSEGEGDMRPPALFLLVLHDLHHHGKRWRHLLPELEQSLERHDQLLVLLQSTLLYASVSFTHHEEAMDLVARLLTFSTAGYRDRPFTKEIRMLFAHFAAGGFHELGTSLAQTYFFKGPLPFVPEDEPE